MRYLQGTRSNSAQWALRSLLGIGLGATLLVWLLRDTDVSQIGHSLRLFSPVFVVIALMILWLSLPLRTLQWQWLLGGIPQASFGKVFRALCLGYLANCILPMRGGELVRAIALSRSSGVSLTRVVSSVVLARLQDLPALLALLACVPLFVPMSELVDSHSTLALSSGTWRVGVWAMSGAVALIGVGAFTFLVWNKAAMAMLSAVVRPFPAAVGRWIESRRATFDAAVSQMNRPRFLLGSLALSFACWALFVCVHIPLLMAFGLDPLVACRAALIVTVVTTFSFLLPSAPAALGTFEAFCVGAMLIAIPGIDPARATAYAIVAHVVAILGPVMPGVLLIAGGRGSIRGLDADTREVSKSTSAEEVKT